MRAFVLSVAIGLGLSGQVAAQNHAGCTKTQRGTADAAIRNAKALALSAAVNVSDTTVFERWFGKYRQSTAEDVRANFKSIFTAIRSGRVTVACDRVSPEGCEAGTYAWVYDDEPYLVHLCPPFFDLPSMAGLNPNSRSGENGTREGTIIHEVSHFRRVAATDDNCYSRDDCSELAGSDVGAVVSNADSYQYFAEDISFYGRSAEVVGKPSADRSGD